jgi:hypothetical protein
MHFNWEINFGTLLTGFVLLCGFVTAHFTNIRRIDRMEYKLNTIYEWFEQHVIFRGDGK